MFTHQALNFWQRYLLIAGGILLTMGFLWWARAVMAPIVLAILIAFVLAPVVARLQRYGLGRVPATLLAVLMTCGLLAGLGYVVFWQLQGLASELPTYKQEIINKIASLQESSQGSWLEDAGNALSDITKQIKGDKGGTQPEPTPVAVESSNLTATIQNVLGLAVEGIVSAALILILTAFLLVQKENLRNRLLLLWGNGSLTGMTRAIDDATQRISRFLMAQLVINIGYGTCISAALWMLGVPFAILWGFLGGISRYIPYLGIWIGAALPILVSIAIMPSWTTPILVAVIIFIVDFFINNVVEPRAYGRSIGVSETGLLIMAAFWAWLWGPLGLVLSTPLTACLAVMGRYVPHLEFFDVLLGDEAVLEPHVIYFQRLLARDENEAAELVDDYVDNHSSEALCKDVLVPALILAEQTREPGHLGDAEREFFLQATREVLDDYLPPSSATTSLNGTRNKRVLVLGCPIRHDGDKLGLEILGRLMAGKCVFQVNSPDVLAAELASQIEKTNPAVIVMASISTGGLPHVRYLCKRLRQSFDELKIVVALWGQLNNQERIKQRLVAAGANIVSFTFTETQEQLLPQVQFLAHVEEKLAAS